MNIQREEFNASARRDEVSTLQRWSRMALLALLLCALFGAVLSFELGDLSVDDFRKAHLVPLIFANLCLAFYAATSLLLMIRTTTLAIKRGGLGKFRVSAALSYIWIVPFFSIHMFLWVGVRDVVERQVR